LDPTPLQRALKVAPERAPAVKARPEQEFFCFTLADLRLGVPSGNVREVIRVNIVTPLPRTPAYIMGVSGHRGEVLPIIDLLRFFGKGESVIGPRTRVFVATSGSFVAGVVTDSVIGLRKLFVDEIVPPPLGGDVAAEHMLGVVNHSAGGEVLNLINFTKVLESARQRAVVR
jgi:purine-binding chemotaxis protein CheW